MIEFQKPGRLSPPFMLRTVLALCCLAPVATACRGGLASSVEQIETIYARVRGLKDQIDTTRARGSNASTTGVPLETLVNDYRQARERLKQSLRTDRFENLTEEDRRALEIMRRALEKDLSDDKEQDAAVATGVDCAYDAGALARRDTGVEALTTRMYACYGQAAENLQFEGKVLDRLTVFSLLPLTTDPEKRRRLFLAEAPIWTAVNGRNDHDSPYRNLVRLRAAKMKQEGTTIEGRVKELGIDPARIEQWLIQVLEVWRGSIEEALIEPWDFAFRNGGSRRALNSKVGLQELRVLNDRYYRDLGADPAALGIHYNLQPRPGKDPVAFTTFGIRPHLTAAGWSPGEPWVFAAYNAGGIDNLAELLHETGHAVHLAAIRGRPAFVDWPDSDIFTEAIADIAALEIDEPAWQRTYLGAEVPLAPAIAARYSSIVMDTAWSLFEIRLHRDPALDPNQVWTDITHGYLRIRPHPEFSWWAVRGQLINAPGYMLNYAVGAILVADLRARVRDQHGPYAEGDASWYAWMSDRLYRFGRARSSREVIEDFLGRPVTPETILDDMRRGQS